MTFMTKAAAAIAALCAAALIGQTVYLGALKRNHDRLAERVERLETREIASRPPDPVAPAPSTSAEPAAAAPESGPAASTAPQSSDATASTVRPDDLEAMIDRKVEEKVKAKGEGNGFGGKKLPLREIAKEAQLPHETELRMAEVVNDGKRKSFELLKLPRADGTNLVDDLVNAFKSDKPEENVKAVFMRIFSEKIPGTDQTYLAGILKIGDEINQRLEQVLTPEQMTSYKHAGVGPLDVETGYDPFAEYLKTR